MGEEGSRRERRKQRVPGGMWGERENREKQSRKKILLKRDEREGGKK